MQREKSIHWGYFLFITLKINDVVFSFFQVFLKDVDYVSGYGWIACGMCVKT